MPGLCDTQIRELVSIEPFAENDKRPDTVSYGVSSYGYDVRVCAVSYEDKNGKYQDQVGLTLPLVD